MRIEYGEPGERTRLLDPQSTSLAQPSQGNRQGAQYSQENDKRDEQSALANILHQNAKDVIDVTSQEAIIIEPNEYNDRTRHYSLRLKGLSISGKAGSYRLGLPNGITAPQMVLAAPPISPAEIQMITHLAEKASKAMREVRIQHREDLVVSFGVPVP
ncbi:hypothetical protein C0Q70_06431 [Pomacea canaliculata]|uniref:Ragulator complex protein LAMTOR1 n=1 Tax=Pomacea canaliculata TaxID=400727 RepID=A0A2T7PP17_POMCA|nr:hypothetical protein C0Q70_06431 [Pomacea canaliculata]